MIRRSFDIELDKKEEMQIVRKWCKDHKTAVKIMLEDEENGCCPFPECCSSFPDEKIIEEDKKKSKKQKRSFCGSLSCNADVCSNGYAYRMS